MDKLEEELIAGYNEDGETPNFCDPWLDRPEDLDILVSDPDWEVRKAVAMAGRDKDLDKLENDENSWVKGEVARQRRLKLMNFFGER